MKVTHSEPERNRYDTSIADMRIGSYGVTVDSRYYLRTEKSAACLDHAESSFHQGESSNDVRVKILPHGTKITITVE